MNGYVPSCLIRPDIDLLCAQAVNTGQINTILTFYEIMEPPIESPLSGIPPTLLKTAIGILAKTGRALTISIIIFGALLSVLHCYLGYKKINFIGNVCLIMDEDFSNGLDHSRWQANISMGGFGFVTNFILK